MHRLEARDTCNSLLGCGRSMKCSLVMQALKTAQVKAGQRVGGSGGVGSVAVQIAKALGAHVTSTCSTKNMQLVQVPDMRNAGLRCSNSFPYLHLPQGPSEHIEENEADIQDFFRAQLEVPLEPSLKCTFSFFLNDGWSAIPCPV